MAPAEHKGIVVAISGGGRSLANFLRLQNHPDHCFKVLGVISSSSNCSGIGIAEKAGLPVFCGDFSSGGIAATTEKLLPWLKKLGEVQLLVLAGFLKKMPLLKGWENKIINIHPALLPKYGGHRMYGMRVHEQVFKNRDKESGASVHFINERYDEGQLIAQAKVRIDDCPDAHAIAERVFRLECKLYPQVVSDFLRGKLPLREQVKWYDFGTF